MTATLWEVRPWRIVTLLELLEGYAAAFWSVSNTLGQAIIRLETDPVLHHRAGGDIGKTLSRLKQLAEHHNFRSLKRECAYFGELLDGHDGPITHQRLRESIMHLVQVTGGELEDRTFLVIPPEYTELYRDPLAAFGKDTIDAFPLVAEDISEAGKCLALNRTTAAVFHLMRAMESAVQAICIKLEISNPEREWGKLLSDIEDKIKKMRKSPTRDAWSETHVHLYHVKQAWRNKTMHPKQTYKFEEAKGVFDAVKVFMLALSKRLSEPLA
jgi:hypothetical protein